MAEIDRVYLTIDAFFNCYGSMKNHRGPIEKLNKLIVGQAMSAYSRLIAQTPRGEEPDPAKRKLVETALTYVRGLDAAVKDGDAGTAVEDLLKGAGVPEDLIADSTQNPFHGQTDIITAANFKDAVRHAMVARRATFPLPGAQPWDPDQDPADALRNDDDIYSFSIFDEFVDPLVDMLPPLYQLGTEGWVPSAEEQAEVTEDDLDILIEALPNDNYCMVCGESGEEPCKTKTGNRAKANHKGRGDLQEV